MSIFASGTAWGDATNATSPFHMWRSAVLDHAKATNDDGRANHARLILWFQSGEPVWMAADGLKQLVLGAARASREDSKWVTR